MLQCACGKAALYRVGDLGYCTEHRHQAIQQIEKYGNPRRGRKTYRDARLPSVERPNTDAEWKAFRKHLVQNATPAELALRELLRADRRTQGRWSFQNRVCGYYADFLFKKARLIVELDGWHHRTTAGKRKDAVRTGHLKSEGYSVIRFMNREVLDCPSLVLDRICESLRARLGNDVGW